MAPFGGSKSHRAVGIAHNKCNNKSAICTARCDLGTENDSRSSFSRLQISPCRGDCPQKMQQQIGNLHGTVRFKATKVTRAGKSQEIQASRKVHFCTCSHITRQCGIRICRQGPFGGPFGVSNSDSNCSSNNSRKSYTSHSKRSRNSIRKSKSNSNSKNNSTHQG